MKQHPFKIDAIVILPEHLHCIWTLPDGDADFSTRWRLKYLAAKNDVKLRRAVLAHPNISEDAIAIINRSSVLNMPKGIKTLKES